MGCKIFIFDGFPYQIVTNKKLSKKE